jgi:hypothetical protein
LLFTPLGFRNMPDTLQEPAAAARLPRMPLR